MTKQQKYNFRMSSKWKTFRLKLKKKFNSVDFITKQPLIKTWNLHHLDLRDKNYTCIKDTDRFLPLNEDTHQFVHWLYRIWCKDKGIITRLTHVMTEMYEYTHDDYKEEEQNECKNTHS